MKMSLSLKLLVVTFTACRAMRGSLASGFFSGLSSEAETTSAPPESVAASLMSLTSNVQGSGSLVSGFFGTQAPVPTKAKKKRGCPKAKPKSFESGCVTPPEMEYPINPKYSVESRPPFKSCNFIKREPARPRQGNLTLAQRLAEYLENEGE